MSVLVKEVNEGEYEEAYKLESRTEEDGLQSNPD